MWADTVARNLRLSCLVQTQLKQKKLWNKLREAANEMKYESEKGPFSVTFSCGIASYSRFRSVLDVTQAADKALYKANHGGRNQVAVSD